MLDGEVLIGEFGAVDGFAARTLVWLVKKKKTQKVVDGEVICSGRALRITILRPDNFGTRKKEKRERQMMRLSAYIPSSKITPLNHESWNDPMKARALVAIASLARTKSAEVLRSLWDDIRVEFEDHPRWRAYFGDVRKKTATLMLE